MKKLSITALVTMLFVLLLSVSVFAAEHKHCVCGENAVGATVANGHTCDKNQVWTAWGDNTGEDTKVPTTSGYYYLTKDITLAAGGYPETGSKIFLCLNGHKIDQNGQTSVYRFYNANFRSGKSNGGDISICCCKGTGIIDGGSKQDDNDGGIFWVQSGANASNFYFYNITIDASKRNVVTPNDSNKKGSTKGAILGLEKTVTKSTVNIYDGTYIGGTAYRGGAFSVSGTAKTETTEAILNEFNMYGGTIKDGTATVNKYSANTANGGNIYLANAKANFVAGTIENGKSIGGKGKDDVEYGSNGGNVSALTSEVIWKGTVVKGGTTSKNGADKDVFLYGTTYNGVLVENGTVPTGDATTIALWVAVLAVSAMGVVALSKKRVF